MLSKLFQNKQTITKTKKKNHRVNNNRNSYYYLSHFYKSECLE